MPVNAVAVIFDMDGVLVDGEPLHYEVVRRLLVEEGVDFSLADYQRYLGTTLESTWADLRNRYSLARTYEWYAEAYDREVIRSYREDAELLPGAEALLGALAGAAVPLALASSSNREWVDAALDALGLRRFFAETVAGDEVARGKPDPEIYLRAAQRFERRTEPLRGRRGRPRRDRLGPRRRDGGGRGAYADDGGPAALRRHLGDRFAGRFRPSLGRRGPVDELNVWLN